jgi:hypothetical protein
MADMGGRARWASFAAAVAIVAIVAIAFMVGGRDREPKTWTIQPGETLRLSADEVLPEDRWRCTGKGGVNGTPEPGRGVANSGGFQVETAADGTVTASCEPGPGGNV